MSDDPVTWRVRARNLPEHADNPIHTDAGARAAGFPSALVAGVTTYAYLTHPLVAAWGVDWLERGGGEVTFKAPVFAEADVACVPTSADDGTVMMEAVCDDQERNPRVAFRAVREAGPVPGHRDGDRLPFRSFVMGRDFAADYGERAGDDLGIYTELGVMHPVTWPQIANRVFSTDLVDGSWVHTRSVIRHHATCPVGATVDVHATVVERFRRRGTRAIVDVLIEHEGRPIATLEHEAIVELDPAD